MEALNDCAPLTLILLACIIRIGTVRMVSTPAASEGRAIVAVASYACAMRGIVVLYAHSSSCTENGICDVSAAVGENLICTPMLEFG